MGCNESSDKGNSQESSLPGNKEKQGQPAESSSSPKKVAAAKSNNDGRPSAQPPASAPADREGKPLPSATPTGPNKKHCEICHQSDHTARGCYLARIGDNGIVQPVDISEGFLRMRLYGGNQMTAFRRTIETQTTDADFASLLEDSEEEEEKGNGAETNNDDATRTLTPNTTRALSGCGSSEGGTTTATPPARLPHQKRRSGSRVRVRPVTYTPLQAPATHWKGPLPVAKAMDYMPPQSPAEVQRQQQKRQQTHHADPSVGQERSVGQREEATRPPALQRCASDLEPLPPAAVPSSEKRSVDRNRYSGRQDEDDADVLSQSNLAADATSGAPSQQEDESSLAKVTSARVSTEGHNPTEVTNNDNTDHCLSPTVLSASAGGHALLDVDIVGDDA